MFKKIKEFNEGNKTLYFVITMVVLIGLLIFNGVNNRKKENTCVMPTASVDDSLIYKYQMKIKKNDEIVIVDAIRNGAKFLFEKTEKGKLNSYYVYYYSIFESVSDNEYIPYTGTEFVSGIDNKMFFLDYINDLSLNSEVENKEDKVCYLNKEELIEMCADNNNTITVTYNDIVIEYIISDVGEVVDMDINIIDKTEPIKENTEVPNSKVIPNTETKPIE